MAPTRREFVHSSVGLAGSVAFLPGGSARRSSSAEYARPGSPVSRTTKPLRILILGGTGFIGPHMVRYAMYRGHSITLFNRGRTNPNLFPGVETLIGDRDGGLDALRGREWDAVIDNSGYVPRLVRDSAELLRDSVGQYLFTSTASVYQFDQEHLDEDAALMPVEDPASEDVNKYYGPLKVLCEEAVRDVFGSRGTVVRLHVVAGPGDPTDRFTYWPVRIDGGGEVIAPGDPDNPVQFIDVRDLSEFDLQLLERGIGGTYNAAGPTLHELSMAEFLYGIRAITNTAISFRWVDDAFLRDEQIRYPLWFSQNSPARGACRVRSHRGVSAGLKFRPLAVTAFDTLEWFKAQDAERRGELKLNADRDGDLLKKWTAQQGR